MIIILVLVGVVAVLVLSLMERKVAARVGRPLRRRTAGDPLASFRP